MKQRLSIKKIFCILTVLAASNYVVAETEETKEEPVQLLEFTPTKIKAPFLEQFTYSWNDRWIVSQSKKAEKDQPEELLQYRGKWEVEEPIIYKSINNDLGLVVKTPAAHHAISASFPEVIDNEGKTLVVQYEVKLQNELECGGAYLKLIKKQDEEYDPTKYNDKTEYVIMFGPDRCGSTNKVHFIFRHKNPITGEYEEKHMNSPPQAKIQKTTVLYTLIVRPDNSFEIKINNKTEKKGNLLEDFTPSVNPPKEINDPDDKKPEDWVDEAKISDPDATKPDDWDEDAPEFIVDEDAKKPSDWLDDEPEMIDDPESVKPEDWDEEEDGDWVPVQIPNPKCETGKCGEWKKPMKKNPDFKGKWKAPLIDNPKYIGPWKPRKIANPNYYEDKDPHNFEPMAAIGFELWTMQNQIMFDNIYIGHSEKDAEKFAEETWVLKHKVEMEEYDKETNKQTDDIYKSPNYTLKEKLGLFYEEFKNDPVNSIKAHPKYALITLALVLLPIISILFVGRPKRRTLEDIHKKDDDMDVENDDEEASKESANDEETSKEAADEEKEEESNEGLKERKNADASKEDDE